MSGILTDGVLAEVEVARCHLCGCLVEPVGLRHIEMGRKRALPGERETSLIAFCRDCGESPLGCAPYWAKEEARV